MSIVTAPWTEREVALLADFQALDDVNFYTCPVHSRLRLIPTRKGWRCADRDCDYEQSWAGGEAIRRVRLSRITETERTEFVPPARQALRAI